MRGADRPIALGHGAALARTSTLGCDHQTASAPTGCVANLDGYGHCRGRWLCQTKASSPSGSHPRASGLGAIATKTGLPAWHTAATQRRLSPWWFGPQERPTAPKPIKRPDRLRPLRAATRPAGGCGWWGTQPPEPTGSCATLGLGGPWCRAGHEAAGPDVVLRCAEKPASRWCRQSRNCF